MKKLLSSYPHLVKEWHPTKNIDLKPENFTLGSDKKVWWKCPNGDDHEWQASIKNRAKNTTGCPFCSGNKPSKTNNLSLNPKLVSEWHPTKNISLNPDKFNLYPEDFSLGSKKIVWWKCPKSDDHEWQASIGNRVNRASGCPFCSGSKPSKTNNLSLNPKLVSEWHPTKNLGLNPKELTYGSKKKVWWKCPKADDHEWESTPNKRSAGQNCPFCRGLKVCKSNSLITLNPELASEWHPTKNGDLKPESFTVGSGKKVWWKCPKDEDHVWQAAISTRIKSGCPFCAGSSTSQPEIRILCELRHLLGPKNVEWRKRVDGVEIDIFLSKYQLGIEYDGSYWHKDKLQSDMDKNKFFHKKGIEIIRIREHPLKLISSDDILVRKKILAKADLNALVLKINEYSNPKRQSGVNSYIDNLNFLNEKEFKRFISFLPSPPPEYSIMSTHPEIAKQWHYDKNSPLIPENFSFGAHKLLWWKCTKGDDHEWESTINSRTQGRGCPFCTGKKVSKTNNLLFLNPDLAKEWHPIKNKELKPESFTVGSGKKVWWQCLKDADHEWIASVSNRKRGSGCPYCAGKKVNNKNSLLFLNPKLSNEWHPIKNKELKPENFTIMSHKKVWWKCPVAEDHEWESTIAHRSNGRGCPFCAGKRASKLSNLLKLKPQIASQWHPSKNDDLKPEGFNLMSNKKVWWKCPKGEDHEWEAQISTRSKGRGCPFCSRSRVSKTNSLQVENSKLASEWHPTKNNELSPLDFLAGSGKKVWWKCPEGEDHEWEAEISGRNKGRGCPFCSGNKVSKSNNLLFLNPKLASEWHPTKNGDLKPENFTHGSGKKVWWKCPNGDDHEWEVKINNRSIKTSGCPFCAGK